MEDEKIIELYFERNQSAIDETDKKYGKLIKNVSHNILNSLPDVEECVSDTYMKLWETIPPNKPARLISYACKIARNLSLNRLKHLKTGKRSAGSYDSALDELAQIIPSDADVEREVESTELSQIINKFLLSLSKDNRMIFVKRYWFFLSVQEIADDMAITESKVTVSLYRTRIKLKKYLIKEGYNL
ncbi:MAG: sigma-70 family RNA polymerase sigma factor [Oscillospiraceae bacterium]|nr:sigma-70 family RNA polymerase sigma factor [Oscillospiraceae bacterium]